MITWLSLGKRRESTKFGLQESVLSKCLLLTQVTGFVSNLLRARVHVCVCVNSCVCVCMYAHAPLYTFMHGYF